MIDVLFTKLDERAIVPRNAYQHDAGWDLFCLEDTTVRPGEPTDIRTGVAIALPTGYYGRIVHRSSAPRKRGLMVLEGTIDAGFRGELFALAYVWLSATSDLVHLQHGDSIAQLIVQEVRPVRFSQVEQLPESERGTKGFGSSGK